MKLDEVNDNILADLATRHKTYFMTSLLSERLDNASLTEVVLYAYLAGHGDFSMTRRYVHPEASTVKRAIEKARGGHTSGHTAEKPPEAA